MNIWYLMTDIATYMLMAVGVVTLCNVILLVADAIADLFRR